MLRKRAFLLVLLGISGVAGGGDITFEVYSSVDQRFTIGYAATDPCEVPVGIVLKVRVTGDCVGTVSGAANVVSVDPCFSVFLDYAHDMPDPNDYTVNPGPVPPSQHPLADPCGAGVVKPLSSVFSICMGRLDPCNAAPQAVADLVTIDFDCDCFGTMTVSIEEDDLRGGVVGAAWETVDAADSTAVVCGHVHEPACWWWDCPTQCHGDCDCDGDVDTVDWPCFRDCFGSAWPNPRYNPCADNDRDGDCDTVDWPVFRDNFGSGGLPADCPIGGTWPPI